MKRSVDPTTLVPRETLDRLKIYADLLLRWNRHINLVSQKTEAELWQRHIGDSLQLLPYLPVDAKVGADLGSGAGFPGLVVAIASNLRFHLIEADRRKAAFLREVAGAVGALVDIHCDRAETADVGLVDVITSRALAPLPKLLLLSERFMHAGTVAIFLKGEKVDDELTDAEAEWHMKIERHESVTSPRGSILRLTEVHRV